MMIEEIRILNMSDGAEETSEVKFLVPESETQDEITYKVTVSKKAFYSSLTTGGLKKFWEGVEKNVLEDVSRKGEKNDKS